MSIGVCPGGIGFGVGGVGVGVGGIGTQPSLEAEASETTRLHAPADVAHSSAKALGALAATKMLYRILDAMIGALVAICTIHGARSGAWGVWSAFQKELLSPTRSKLLAGPLACEIPDAFHPLVFRIQPSAVPNCSQCIVGPSPL